MTGTDSTSIATFSTSGTYQYRWTVGTDVNGMAYGPVLVPEPSTCAMALTGTALGGWQIWRGSRRRTRTA